jgi:hypothetical protein
LNGVNIGGGTRGRRDAGAAARQPLREPAFVAVHVGRIAQAQVFVRQALAAGQHGIGELRRLHRAVALDVLEPLHRIARRALQLEHFHRAHRLVRASARCIGMLAEAARQLDRIFQRQLGARADRIMRVCAASPISTTGTLPSQCTHLPQTMRGKVIHMAEPRRWAALDIRWPSSCSANSARRRRSTLPGSFDPAPPRATPFRRFDDEGRGVGVVLIDVRLEPAVLRLFEGEGERIELLVRAQPDKAAVARLDLGW